ncbi:MAG: BrnT family toxin [Caldilineaceae bacterium]|nr:BrnT family toxin [Caldilineaceae bacterium]
MEQFDWNPEKNLLLKAERGISFDEIVLAIEQGHLLDVVQHPNQEQYPNQSIYVINLQGYVYLVPFVHDKERIFLKTIIPSRKATRNYLRKGQQL